MNLLCYSLMKPSTIAQLFLASLMAFNGSPALTASTPSSKAEEPVLSDWANALGMAGGQGVQDEITAVDYWATGTVRLNDAPCALKSFHVSLNYQVPSMRQEFSCIDASGKAHYQVQEIAGRSAWNEIESGGDTSAVGDVDERLTQLWSGPLALVKAATTAGAATRISAEHGHTVVTFPVPGVRRAILRATLNDRHQAAQVDARFGNTTIHTTYTDYVDSHGSDFRFYTSFPRHIVQERAGVTLADLTVTRVSRAGLDMSSANGVHAANVEPVRVAPVPSSDVRGVPSSWKDKKSFGKLDQNLRRVVARGCDGAQSVIIRTTPEFRGGLRDSLKNHGNQVTGEFASINAVGARVSCDDLQTLAGFGATLSVSVNAKVRTTQAPGADPSVVRDLEGQGAALLQTPMLQTLLGDNFEDLRNAVPANGSIGVAVIDSGIAPGPDFGDRITAFYDFTQGGVDAAEPSDGYGHGTHVAGLAASRYVGVNPNARLIGLKVLDGQGQGNSVDVLRAIEFAMINKDALDIQVLNLSLGHPIYEMSASDPLVQAVEGAVRMGLVVVVSSGNFGIKPGTDEAGYGGIASPGNAPSAFSVGAVRVQHRDARRRPYRGLQFARSELV